MLLIRHRTDCRLWITDLTSHLQESLRHLVCKGDIFHAADVMQGGNSPLPRYVTAIYVFIFAQNEEDVTGMREMDKFSYGIGFTSWIYLSFSSSNASSRINER